jgi:hypothetical protein
MKTFQSIDSTIALYEGSKTLWKQNVTLEINIILHENDQILELIIFNPQLNIESPRLYVSYNKVIGHIRDEVVEIQSSEKHELFKIQFQFIVDETEIEQAVFAELVNQYLLSRIEIRGNSKAFLQIAPGDAVDTSTGLLDVECAKPDDLIPFAVIRNLSEIDENNADTESQDDEER